MKLFWKFICLLLPLVSFAQAPQTITYQAVIRDTTGVLVQNQSVGLNFMIIQGSPGNLPSYEETTTTSTNSNGLISHAVGLGIVVRGSMAQIDWSNGPYYMVVNIDPTGGTNYWLSSLAEIYTVPYAFYANRADSADYYLELDPLFQNSVAATITANDTARWNAKADSLNEVDPIFVSSLAYTIAASDTAYWNNKVDTLVEIDPIFSQSLASGISSADTAYWNSKLDSLVEVDPLYSISVASQISANDTLNWNNKLDQEVDGDTLNELQNLYLNGDTLKLSNSTAYAIIPPSPDRDTTNEIQTLSISSDTISLSKANAIVLPAEVDADTLNEIQSLTIIGDSISLSKNGGTAVLPEEVDGDTLNEIQGISIDTDTIFLSKNGGSIILPVENDGDTLNEIQGLNVSETGDTLFLTKSNWVIIPGISISNRDTALVVGSIFGGGVVAYLLEPGDLGYDSSVPHGIIAHISDIGFLQYGCYQNLSGNKSLYISGYSSLAKPLSNAIGMGQYNTGMLLKFCGASSSGATACDTLSLNGFTDWVLPSAAELQEIAINLHYTGLNTYTNFDYLSSSEAYESSLDDGRCFTVSFNPNPLYGLPTITKQGRGNQFRVIPVRYF